MLEKLANVKRHNKIMIISFVVVVVEFFFLLFLFLFSLLYLNAFFGFVCWVFFLLSPSLCKTLVVMIMKDYLVRVHT